MADLTLAGIDAGATPKMPMPVEPVRTILALDLGTTTGWALREPRTSSEQSEWRPIPDWRSYEVSSDGRVRRVRQSKGALAGRVLRPLLNKKTGYLSVCLCERSRMKRVDIHRLVALAFHGPAPSSRHVVAHNNGIRTNNTAENLRWATQAENLGDCWAHGTAMVGSRNPSSSISELDVLAIRRMKTFGIPRTVIAEGYGMHLRSIFRILSKTSWEHVQ
ncbi:MAG: NUMOD4 motif-containing HNH endonuclease [Pararhodobacter sp.]|nr:NUMOD4 motif-containing HNH endonuclease [Pararhodobacter sp.]